MSEKLLKSKPYKINFELSSKWILTKNPNPGFTFSCVCVVCVCVWGGGGGLQK